MSFYGSIYYQLIDTFYKIVLRNNGRNSTKFCSNVTDEVFESRAAGRRGVFGFDTGNRWINLNEKTYVNSDDNENYSIYEIYHGKPDPKAEDVSNSFKLDLTDEEIESRKKNGVIQLNFADKIKVCDTTYDKAGHIAKVETQTYQLPISQVNEDVDSLKKLVGSKLTKYNFPTVSSTDANLHGYVSQNFKDISTLESYVGDWTNSVSEWSKNNAPTIIDAIGNLDDMYGDVNRAEKHQPFSKIIGNLPELWKKFNKENYISLSDIILQEREDFETLDKSTSNALDLLTVKTNDIGTRPDGYDTIYTEIIELHELLDTLTKNHAKDKTNMENAYKAADQVVTQTIGAEINTLNAEVENAKTAINTINNTTIPSINRLIDSIDDRIEAHEKNWVGTEKALTDVDDELAKNITAVSDSIGTLAEGKTVVKMIEDLTEADGKIRKDLTAVDDKIREDLDNTTNIANTNKTDIETINKKIGTVGDKALSVQINENLSDINSLNANALMKSEAETTYAKKTDLDVYAKSSDISTIDEKIDGVITALGLSTDFGEDIPEGSTILKEIFSKLSKIEEDIANIKIAMNTLHADNPPFEEKSEGEIE